MSETIELTLCANGPILLAGTATAIIDGETRSAPGSERVAICRCGDTANAPFCDGSHGRNGFSAAGGQLSYQPRSTT